MSIWKRLATINRRWIFLTLTIGVIVPMLFPLRLPVAVTKEVRTVYDRLESLSPGDVILMSLEYDPSTRAEMEPMTYAIMRHAFRKDLKVIVDCLMTNGVSLVEQEIRAVADEADKVYGEDYVYLGYKPYPAIVILAMGEDFRQPFPFDYYKTDTDSLPMMRGVRNYDDTKLVITVNATSGVDFWIQYGVGRYHIPLAIAVTAVMATDYYTFLHSGQIVGLIGGMKGAAEYERLIDREGYATKVMNIQSVVHALIVVFILLGNVAYLMSGGRIRMGGRA